MLYSPDKISYADGDVILRAADGTEFQAHAVFLRHASAVLQAMLQSHTKQTHNSLGVIDTGEDQATVDFLLRCVYPVAEKPTLSSLEEIRTMMHAAHKFDLGCAISPLGISLIGVLTPENALVVWAIATRFGLKTARVAATRCIIANDIPQTLPPGAPHEDLMHVTAYDLACLNTEREKIVAKARAIASGPINTLNRWHTCEDNCSNSNQTTPAQGVSFQLAVAKTMGGLSPFSAECLSKSMLGMAATETRCNECVEWYRAGYFDKEYASKKREIAVLLEELA